MSAKVLDGLAAASARSALQRLELRRGAGAQEAEIAADREEADAALGAGHRALGIGAIEAGDLAGLAAGRDDLVERRLDGPRSADRAPCRRSARSTGRRGRRTARRCRAPPRSRRGWPSRSWSRSSPASRCSALASRRYVFRSAMPASDHRPRRAPASLAERRILGRADEGLGVGDGVDHRRDDALGAEVERAARHRKRAERHAHDGRRARRADRTRWRSRSPRCPRGRAADRW